IGIVLFAVMRTPLANVRRGLGRLESLRIVLRIYAGLLILFMLMPLDFALSGEDLAACLERVPDSLTDLSGEGRPLAGRMCLLVAAVFTAATLGALLTTTGRGRLYVGRSVSASAWIGFFAMLGVYVLTTRGTSAAPSLPMVGIRTAGIALGAWAMHWL